ncbi:MAG: hypothetical protein ACON5A_03425 [Candidatus Comchoanobacterales bacterium]
MWYIVKKQLTLTTLILITAISSTIFAIDGGHYDHRFSFKISGIIFNEINDKLNITKELINNDCYTPATSTMSTQAFNIANEQQRFITEWGCTNSNNTVSNLVSGYVVLRDDIGMLSNAKIMLVAKDSQGNRINTDSGGAQAIDSWCYHFVDNDATDGITTSQYIDMDANGSNEFDLARVFKGIGCGTIN